MSRIRRNCRCLFSILNSVKSINLKLTLLGLNRKICSIKEKFNFKFKGVLQVHKLDSTSGNVLT